MPTTTYVIRARPAVRAYGLGAVLAVVGAILVVWGSANAWPLAVVVIGGVLTAAALALVAAALVAGRRASLTIDLDERGYRIAGPTDARAGDWADVTRVTGSPGRLTFHAGDGSFVLLDPSGDTDQFGRLGADIARRLDADRGYGVQPAQG